MSLIRANFVLNRKGSMLRTKALKVIDEGRLCKSPFNPLGEATQRALKYKPASLGNIIFLYFISTLKLFSIF